ncbi:Retrovirus-related Pol polyprotein from transposon RE2 [Vitis vinifera]|uniref:Retrovirus-related Pol polyprotein from transposon RE2 n=1 Tax=Vitis vinifera TaxID=29760 RepID=A0A438DCM1_VITVI|nr:Retrovirus-related Pol polyprotein from transposon RE2 [Vitis vinifera]
MFLPTAKDVGDAIRETYSDVKNASQIFEIKTRLWQIKQGDREVTEYNTEMLGLWQDLDLSCEEEWEYTGDSVRFKKKMENERVFEFLTGLNRELDDVRSKVLNRRSLPSIRDGTLSPIASKGSIRISESITLNPVLHDLSSGKTIGSAKEHEGLYYFDETDVLGQCSPTVYNSASYPKDNELLLWHKRMGHPNFQPSQFWGDSILTATYLINRMPSRVLSFVTSLQKFQEFFPHSRLDAHLPLHVFGSTVFVHTHGPKRNKFDPRALKSYSLLLTSRESMSETRSSLTSDYLDVAMFESIPCLISTPSPNTEGHLNSWGDTELQKNRETLVYSRRPKSKFNETLISEAPKESEPVIVPTPQEYGSNSDQCHTSTTNLDRIQIPKNIQEAFEIPEWKEAVMEEIRALEKNETWEVMNLPRGKKLVGLAKLNIIQVLLSLASNLDWPLHQFDIKNAFLNGELEEEVFMMLPPGFYKEEEETRSNDGRITILIVYVDDIILTGDDTGQVERLKKVLATEFEVKDLGQMRYFLGMEVARSRKGINISQRKYVLDLLTETGMLGCKPSDTPIEARNRMESDGKLVDKEKYQRLVGRLIYLSHTRPDIAFAVSVVSQYMHSPKESHLEAVYKILRYLKGSPGRGLFFKKSDSKKVEIYTDADWVRSTDDRRSTTSYCT